MNQNDALLLLFQHEKDLKKLEKNLMDLENDEQITKMYSEIHELTEQLNEDTHVIENKQRQMKASEMESEQLHQNKKQLENDLYSGEINDSKELKDMSERITKLSKQEQEYFDNYCEIMEEIEGLQKKYQQNEQYLKKVKDDLANKREQINREIAELQEKIEKIKISIAEIKPCVSEELYDKYMELKKRFSKDPVVSMSPGDDTCGCGLDLSTEQQANLNVKQLILCNNCGRILILT